MELGLARQAEADEAIEPVMGGKAQDAVAFGASPLPPLRKAGRQDKAALVAGGREGFDHYILQKRTPGRFPLAPVRPDPLRDRRIPRHAPPVTTSARAPAGAAGPTSRYALQTDMFEWITVISGKQAEMEGIFREIARENLWQLSIFNMNFSFWAEAFRRG